jgi:hypothetical protein
MEEEIPRDEECLSLFSVTMRNLCSGQNIKIHVACNEKVADILDKCITYSIVSKSRGFSLRAYL